MTIMYVCDSCGARLPNWRDLATIRVEPMRSNPLTDLAMELEFCAVCRQRLICQADDISAEAMKDGDEHAKG